MVNSTPKKRVLFARSLTPVLLAVFGVLSLLVINLHTSHTVLAAVSSTVNFQARLQNSGGSIVPDGNYNIEFKLYNASTSSGSSQGSCTGDSHCLWTEDYTGANVVTVKNGYLSVHLGSITAFPGTIDWSQQMYLTMNVGGTGTPSWDGEMNPRLSLTATPYAFDANAVGGLTASQLGQLAANQTWTGANTIQDTSTTAFQVENSSNALLVGVDTSGNNVNIGATGTTALNSYVNVGTSSASSNSQFVTVGSLTGSSSTLIQSGASSGLGIQVAAGGTIAIGTTYNNNVQINTVATTGYVTIGGTSQTGTITIGQSTASNSIHIGTSIGASNTQQISIGTSSSGITQITIGSTSSSSNTNIQAGSGGISLSVSTGSAINIGTTNANLVSIGSASQVQPAQFYVKNTNSSNRTAIFQAASGQSQDVLDIYDGSNNFVSGYDASGNLYLNGSLQTGNTTAGGAVKIADGSGHTTWLVTASNSTNSPTITLPNASGTVCLDSQNCSSSYIEMAPSSAQTTSSNNAAIFVNDSGTGNLLQLQSSSSNEFVVSNSGTVTVTGGIINNGYTLEGADALGNVTTTYIGGSSNSTAAAATVDKYTYFTITQTTTSISATIPTPTTTTAGRIIHVSNLAASTQSITVGGVPLAAGSSAEFLWNGTAWTSASALSTSGVTAATYGSASQVAQFTVNAQGIITAASNVNITGFVGTSASFGGDVSGTYNNLTVAKIQNTAVTVTSLANTNFLVYNGSAWVNESFSGDITVTNTGAATIASGAVTGSKIASSTITNTNLVSGGYGAITGASNLVTVGALSGGSITTGFGTINTSNAITGTTITASTGFVGGSIDTSGATTLSIGTTNASGVNIGKAGSAIGITGTTTVTGALSATSVSGNGSGLTSLNASNISSGTLSNSRLNSDAAITDSASTVNFTTTLQQGGNNVCTTLASTCNTTYQAAGSYLNNSTSVQSANAYIQAATSGSVAAKIQGNASGTADIMDVLDGSNNTTFKVTSTGAMLIKPGTGNNSTTYFQVQPASSSTPVLDVDTTNGRVGVDMNNPAYALDVNGYISTNSGVYVNGAPVCTTSCIPSGGSGNYIWNTTAFQTGGANISIQSPSDSSVVAVLRAKDATQTGDLLDVQAWNGTSVTNSDSFGADASLAMVSGATTGNALGITAAGITTGNGISVAANGLTSGNGINITSTSVSQTGSGALLNVSNTSGSQQLTTNGSSTTGSMVSVSRNINVNIAGGGSTTPTVDQKAYFSQSSHGSVWTPGSVTNPSFTITAGHSNYYIFVTLSDEQNCDDTHMPTVSVGGTSLTLIDHLGDPPLDSGSCYFLFGHTISTTGSVTITAADTDSGDYYSMEVDDWYNVNQTTPYGVEASDAGGQTGTAVNTSTPTITSGAWASGHIIVEHNVVNDTSCNVTTASGQSPVYVDSGGVCANPNGMYVAYKTSAGGSQTLSWSGGPALASAYWIETAIDLIGATAASTGSVTGAADTFSSNCTQTSGGCIDATNVIQVQQQFSGATGAVMKIQNAGAGDMLDLANGSGTVLDSFSSNGSLTMSGSLTVGTVTDTETVAGTGSGHSFTESTPATAYYLYTDVANTTTTDIYNITGVSNTNGAMVFIAAKAQRTATGTNTITTTVQINGTQVLTVNAGSGTTAGVKGAVVMYISGAWHIIAANDAAAGTGGTDSADYAEWIDYSGDSAPQPGDILTIGDDATSVKDSITPYDNHVIGVVSTDPYEVGGADDGHSVVLALAGRVPVKVDLENGPIEPGDPLTSSSTPGVAMKATSGGQIIGTALEAYDGTQGGDEINVQLHVGYDNPNPGSIQGDANIGGGLYVAGSADIEGDLTVAGTTSTQNLAVSGNATLAALNVSGGISADGVTVAGTVSSATLTVSGTASFGGDVTIGGHFITGGATPTTAVNAANAGNTATCTASGDDTSGTITLQSTGVNQAAGSQCTLTFAEAFGTAPRTVVSPNDSPSAAMGAYIQATPTTMTLNFTGVPAAGQTYTYNYFNPQ